LPSDVPRRAAHRVARRSTNLSPSPARAPLPELAADGIPSVRRSPRVRRAARDPGPRPAHSGCDPHTPAATREPGPRPRTKAVKHTQTADLIPGPGSSHPGAGLTSGPRASHLTGADAGEPFRGRLEVGVGGAGLDLRSDPVGPRVAAEEAHPG